MTIADFKQRAQKSVDHFFDIIKTIRTGRATPSLVENLMVDAYGSKMPLNQLASIGIPEPRVVTITVWDTSVANAVVDAIKKSELGVNPVHDTNLIRLNLPVMTEERRKEFAKMVGRYEEEAKVGIRNLRREYLDEIKKQNLPDELYRKEEEIIDKETKSINLKIEEISAAKQKELMEL